MYTRQEWAAFHLQQGVEHLYVTLNDCEDDTQEALRPFVEVRGWVPPCGRVCASQRSLRGHADVNFEIARACDV
jgi:hypothetical protein